MSLIINKKKCKPFLGSQELGEVWLGKRKIYPEEIMDDSYLILTDDTRIDFNSNNTPIANFETSSKSTTTSLTINGHRIVKGKIKEIYFGESYSDVTSIGNWFLGYCSGLTSVDLSGLSNVTSIGDYFLYNCSSLTSVDLSPLSNLTSIGNYFLGYCSGLTSVDLSLLSNVTSIGDGFLSYCESLTSVDLSGLTSVTSIESGFLWNCSKLVNIYGTTSFNNNLNLKVSKLLTYESLTNIINSLVDLSGSSAKVLTLYSVSYNLLSEDDILTITNKNWTIAL